MWKILGGILLGAIVGCLVGVGASVALAYLNHLRPGLANFQRDLWPLLAVFLALLIVPIGGGIGGLGGGLVVYLKTRNSNCQISLADARQRPKNDFAK